MIIVSSFREEAAAQKSVIGIHNDLALLFKELSQSLTGAPSNALLAELFQAAAPHKMKTNIWARLRGQQEQLTIQVLPHYPVLALQRRRLTLLKMTSQTTWITIVLKKGLGAAK